MNNLKIKVKAPPDIKLDLQPLPIKYPEDYREIIEEPDKIIITDESISIKYDYPVRRITFKHFDSKGGFTKYQLYKCICDGYKQLAKGGFIINHVLEELFLNAVYYDNLFHICTLHVDS